MPRHVPARPEGCCVSSPRGDCFCFTRLPSDAPQRVAVLLLEEAADELAAVAVFRAPCKGTTLLSGGVNDLFSPTVGGEPAMPSAGLAALIAQNSSNPPASSDTVTDNRHFGQSFSLPSSQCVFGAWAVLRAGPLSSPFPGSRNDAIHLGFVNPTGQFTGAHWAAFFGSGNTGLPALLPNQWLPGTYPLPQGATFVLNLGALPGGATLLGDLDSKRFLDVYVLDDTAIHYLDLVAKLCPCPEPSPEPCGLEPGGVQRSVSEPGRRVRVAPGRRRVRMPSRHAHPYAHTQAVRDRVRGAGSIFLHGGLPEPWRAVRAHRPRSLRVPPADPDSHAHAAALWLYRSPNVWRCLPQPYRSVRADAG